jgi:hypothetical protein
MAYGAFGALFCVIEQDPFQFFVQAVKFSHCSGEAG